MAHELERRANGQTAFASARLSAWHQLGTVTEDTMDAATIMAKAFLGGWRVRKIDIRGVETTPDGVDVIECDDRWMTVRTNVVTGVTEYLGIVGEDYVPVQNEQVAETLNLLSDQAGSHFETAGSMQGGKKVFVTMKLPDTMQVGGVDNLDLYLAATTSHDGTASLRVDATPVRIVCANTQRAAFARTQGFYIFRHTSRVNEQISQAREALRLVWKHLDAFQAEAEKMINETLTIGAFEKVVAELWPLPDDASDITKNNHRKRSASLRYLLRDADTQKAIKGTRWAGYQAITEYVDHFQPAKTPEVRAARALSLKGTDLKTRAFELLSV
jgi:phage/plasmid-like protein (TIGR03299 family)